MKNLSLYKDSLSVPRKQDLDGLTKRVDDAEAQLTVFDSDIASIESDITSIRDDVGKKLTTPTGSQGQLLGFTANNVVGAIDAPSSFSSGSYFNKKYTGTLSTTWQGSSAPYYQQFDIAGIDDTMTPLVFPQWSASPASDAQKTAWNAIYGSVESFNGYVRFYTKTKTTTEVNFIMYYGNPEKPHGGEPVSLIDNNVKPPVVRNGQFFEDV